MELALRDKVMLKLKNEIKNNKNNVLEHLNDTIKPIEELWRITKNKGIIKIWVPLYPSIGCFADPTHKQTFTYMSFNYFREEDGLNYYSCARFKIKKRKIIFSKYLYWFVKGYLNRKQDYKK